MKKDNHSPYVSFSREEWAKLRYDTPMTMTKLEMEKIQGLNENLSLTEVKEIYLPLVRFLELHIEATKQLHQVSDLFFKQKTKKVPFVIGIAGSVAVGKSTTARIIQTLLSDLPSGLKVDLVTTDGFLYPNRVLEKKGILDKKGFPQSYDIKALLTFLTKVKSGSTAVKAPIYSHLFYDIIPDHFIEVNEPDVLIMEGINVLQTPKVSGDRLPSVYVSDFFDLSIYVDADEAHIFDWYVERFKLLKETAFKQPDSYFNRYSNLTDQEAEEVAANIWNKINKKNLEQNIRPTKMRADIIIKKGSAHRVSKVDLRKI